MKPLWSCQGWTLKVVGIKQRGTNRVLAHTEEDTIASKDEASACGDLTRNGEA